VVIYGEYYTYDIYLATSMTVNIDRFYRLIAVIIQNDHFFGVTALIGANSIFWRHFLKGSMIDQKSFRVISIPE
jgi:hypothetical protein